jgi:hypothetical protein
LNSITTHVILLNIGLLTIPHSFQFNQARINISITGINPIMLKDMLMDTLNVGVKGHVNITENFPNGTSNVLFDGYNAVHPQNMARIIARALAHEPNSYIWRLALGDGGAGWAADGSVIIKPPITGTDGSGWESRLYNETYSEIVDDTSPLVGTDPGSADANNVRPGGGADPSSDPAPDSVVSQEVGTKSNVIVTMYLNENEPSGQNASSTDPINGAANDFIFNELGLYSSGLQARDSSGYSSVNVGNKLSTDISVLTVNTSYNIQMNVDGITYNAVIRTPASGTGPSGALTYGDICEGINGGTWILSGDPINNYVYVFITDESNGSYPSILNAQSYGYLNFQSRTAGSTSTVALSCTSGAAADFFNNLVSGICGNVNYVVVPGANAGVANDPVTPTNERERLLTHLTFSPLTKAANSQIVITYTLTVSVNPTTSTVINELA